MMTPYKRAMSSLALSPQARERIEGRLRRKPVRRRAVRPAVTAAVLLALVLGTTAMADGVFSHDIPAAIVQSLTPVRLSDTSQGITMTVQSAGVEDGVFTAYITMQDQRGGGRLARGVGIYDSYRINTPFRSDLVASGCTPLGYDEASQSYGFLVQIRARDGQNHPLDFSNGRFTFSVRQLLLEQERGQATAFRPDWSGVPLVPVDTAQYILGGSGKDFETYSGWLAGGEALTLQPGGWEMPLIEGVSISAAGFMGDQFHLQLRFDGDGPDDHGWFDLLTPMGVAVQNPVNLAFRDEDGTKYEERVYNISPEDLPGCTLSGVFTTGGYLLDGNWTVTFSLEK
ncbi:MAG: hypothetical protein K2P15_05365 [Oscillospiraceae bacterium]|nr:hypothetical protein [Oscillospiraceae bacterium]